MKLDHRRRASTLAYDCAVLISEMRDARADSNNKARIRRVLRHLDAAHNSLSRAIGEAGKP